MIFALNGLHLFLLILFLQVVRGDFIVFFNQIFDALCKLSADSDANVQSAAHLLDRLVKVIMKHFDSPVFAFGPFFLVFNCELMLQWSYNVLLWSGRRI